MPVSYVRDSRRTLRLTVYKGYCVCTSWSWLWKQERISCSPEGNRTLHTSLSERITAGEVYSSFSKRSPVHTEMRKNHEAFCRLHATEHLGIEQNSCASVQRLSLLSEKAEPCPRFPGPGSTHRECQQPLLTNFKGFICWENFVDT